MARLLVLAAAALLLAYLLSEALARLRGRLGELIDGIVAVPPRRGGQTADRIGSKTRRGEELVACVVCGVHVPRPRAIVACAAHRRGVAAAFYCSEACRRGSASRRAATRGAA